MSHQITAQELMDWMNEDAWNLAASSCGRGSRKQFEMNNNKMFRVTDRGEVTYLGFDVHEAVEAYNAAP